MARCLQPGLLAALMLMLAISTVVRAQRYEPLPPPLAVDPCAVPANPKLPVVPDPKAKPVVCPPPGSAKPASPAPAAIEKPGAPSAAEQFPFPGQAPTDSKKPDGAAPSAAEQFPYPGSAPAPAAGSAPAGAPAGAAPGSAGDKFPYPGETSKSPDAVPEGDTPRYVPEGGDSMGKAPATPKAPESGSSSSSSDSSSSSRDSLPSGLDDAAKRDTTDAPPGDATPTEPKVSTRRKLPKVKTLSPDERVTEDLTVAKFYSGRGNYAAAYLRGKDATAAMPDDAESHFVVAEAARKLEKKDEAVAEYNAYLKLEPEGDWSKAAKQALSELR